MKNIIHRLMLITALNEERVKNFQFLALLSAVVTSMIYVFFLPTPLVGLIVVLFVLDSTLLGMMHTYYKVYDWDSRSFPTHTAGATFMFWFYTAISVAVCIMCLVFTVQLLIDLF